MKQDVNSSVMETLGSAPRTPLQANFWVAHSQFFSSTLFFMPPGGDGAGHAYELRLLDCDGELINELQLEYPSGDVGVLELEPLMSGCKLEAGVSHGQAIICGAVGSSVVCHLHSAKSASLAAQLTVVDENASVALPVTFAREHATLVALVNRSDTAVTVALKLVLGKRSPETTLTIGAQASRLIGLETEFGVPANLDSLGARGLPGYLKVRAAHSLGVQLIDQDVVNDSFRALS